MSARIGVNEFETLGPETLQPVAGGIDWRKYVDYAAPLMSVVTPAATPLLNKDAAAEGLTRAGAGVARSGGSPLVMAKNAAIGFATGYYGTLLRRDFPGK
jgi:hypothetical protein